MLPGNNIVKDAGHSILQFFFTKQFGQVCLSWIIIKVSLKFFSPSLFIYFVK